MTFENIWEDNLIWYRNMFIGYSVYYYDSEEEIVDILARRQKFEYPPVLIMNRDTKEIVSRLRRKCNI